MRPSSSMFDSWTSISSELRVIILNVCFIISHIFIFQREVPIICRAGHVCPPCKSLHFGALWLSTHSTNRRSDCVIGKISFWRIRNTPLLCPSDENWLISQQVFKMSTLTLERAPLARGPQVRFPLKQRLRHWVDNGRFQGERSLRSGTRSN